MTKLTQQEIEQERVKFEEWFLKRFGYSIANEPFFEKDHYGNTLTDIHWQPWLARAELAKGEK